MTLDPRGRVEASQAWCAATRGTWSGEFVDLMAADDDWVRREFDAIVAAAGWGGAVPPCPGPKQGAHWPRRPGYDGRPTPVRCGWELLRGARSMVHQRGPPR